MSSPKKQKFCGFSTAGEFMNGSNTNTVGGGVANTATDDDCRQEVSNSTTNNNTFMEAREIISSGGFSTAKEFMESIPTKSEETTAPLLQPDQSSYDVLLKVRGLQYHKENLESLESLSLHRDVKNLYDANAIAVQNEKGGTIGHIAKEQAAQIAQSIDSNVISLDNVSLKEQKDNIMIIKVSVNLLDDNKREDFVSVILPRIIRIQSKFTTREVKYCKKNSVTITNEAVKVLAKGITDQDSETATTCKFDITTLESLPWKKNADGSVTTWPPSQDFLDSLGYGAANDEKWWQENTGLKPPSVWNVSGALDLLPKISISASQKARAADVLEDAIHGVTNVWSDTTLGEVRHLMESDKFWCYRSSDAFIKAYGGPYILGQQEDKLKLIKGNPHTPLTDKICRGHNVVYELVHMTKPPAPGFNTLIFGLNLRRSGFHYHQDTIANLKAKNAPLVGKQPVVTTVYYEKPDEDNGKELVLWKPLLNFTPRFKDDSLYNAARGCQTYHGMVHVQRAGLQSHAQHGIFHTPVFEDGKEQPTADPRKGYRVAITARITYPDSDKMLEPYLNTYCRTIGPHGDKTLCLSDE